MDTFENNLNYGFKAERETARILDALGYEAIRIAKEEVKDPKTGKTTHVGPKFMSKGHCYDAPDIELYRPSPKLFRHVQVKHTETCRWWENNRAWRLGMNYAQYLKYCEAYNKSKIELLVVFTVEGGKDPKCQMESPAGMFVQELSKLQKFVEDSKGIHKTDPKRFTDIHPALEIKEGQTRIDAANDDKKKEREIFWDLRLLDDIYKWHSLVGRKVTKSK